MSWVRRAGAKNSGWQATCPVHKGHGHSGNLLSCTRTRIIPGGQGVESLASKRLQHRLKCWLSAAALAADKDDHGGMSDAEFDDSEIGVEEALVQAINSIPGDNIFKRCRRH